MQNGVANFECKVAHDCCATETSDCAFCRVNLSHLVVLPVRLACGDLACRRCTKRKSNVDCKLHGLTEVLHEVECLQEGFEEFLVGFKNKLNESLEILIELIQGKCK